MQSEHPFTRAEFKARLLRFINETLPQFDRRGRVWPLIEGNTQLFANGLLDSLSILHLITAVEEMSGRPVPDELVVMKHFQTVDAMSAAFSPKS